MLLEDLINSVKKRVLALQQEILDTPYGQRFLDIKVSQMTAGEAFKGTNIIVDDFKVSRPVFVLDVIDKFDHEREHDGFEGVRLIVNEDPGISGYFGDKENVRKGIVTTEVVVNRVISAYCVKGGKNNWFEDDQIKKLLAGKVAQIDDDRFFKLGDRIKTEDLKAGMTVMAYDEFGATVTEVVGLGLLRDTVAAINKDLNSHQLIQGKWLTDDVVKFKSMKDALKSFDVRNVKQLSVVLAEKHEENLVLLLKSIDDGFPSAAFRLVDGIWKNRIRRAATKWPSIREAIEL